MSKKSYYEYTYILNPVLDDEKYKAAVEKVNNLIVSNGGEIDEVDEWGLRSFAYEMDKKSNGYYVNMYFTAPPEAIALLDRAMRIDDNVLRQLVLKYDAKMLRHRELQKKNELPSIFNVPDEQEEGEDSSDSDE